MPYVSVVVSGDFCRFKLALPSLLSMSKDFFLASPTHWPRNSIAPLPHISYTSPPLRFVAWCSKNNKRFSFMLFGVFLAILVERKTPLTTTKGTERQKKGITNVCHQTKMTLLQKWFQNRIFCRFQEFNSDSA